DQALALNPQLFQVWFHRGNVLRQMRRLTEALSSYEQAVKLQPDHAAGHYNCAVLLERCGRYRDALSSYERAVSIYPEFHEAHFNRAGVLKQLGEREAALASYDRAIAAKPDYAEAHSNRGVLLQELGRRDEALASCDRAISIRCNYPEAHFNRGTLLQANMQFEAALASYDRAIALRPDYAEAYCDRAGVLLEVGRVNEALVDYERATTIRPDFAEANLNRSLALLLHGDYEEGWRLHEWRWKNAERLQTEWRSFKQPLWLGEEEIFGKTLLLYCEQGLGDTLQFCRFAKTVAERGATVILEVQAPLVSLLKDLDGVSLVVPEGGLLPPFDYHCPLLSLPLALKTTLDTIPAPRRYLHSQASKIPEWESRLGPRNGPRIGLVWSGNPKNGRDHNRSVRLLDWIEHLPRDFQYICLQREIRPADREVLEANRWISTFDPDFTETAALCECVDLVISVCTSIAHLSAGLGRNTWVMLPFAADWRWLVGRIDSPWYPSVTLYRQHALGDWQGLFARVAADLHQVFR
ncbi:MAG TPA: tetratricopeptide repeat-containing glycosyltransferase family protein, partial [Steroidobacteraceae bacterium]